MLTKVAWSEARRKADVVSHTLADTPANVRLSLAEAAARVLEVDRATLARCGSGSRLTAVSQPFTRRWISSLSTK